MVSVIIPAKNEVYLERTIRNVLANARGEVEIIAELDGWVPDPQINIGDDRVIFVYHEKSIGQRACINDGARRAKGEFVMKLDAHCAVGEGFDIILSQNCEPDWTVIPRMFNLDHETWLPKKHKMTDYMYIGCGEGRMLRAEYYGSKQPLNDLLIDDTMCCMGPCFFMRKERFWELEGCDEGHVGGWGQQGVEVSCKAWLSGGSLKVNKLTWFAHWFRGGGGPGFPYDISGKQVETVRKYSRDLWLNDRWHLQKRKFQWLLDKFNPPGWSAKQTKPQWGHIGSVILDVEDVWNRRRDFCDPRKRENLEWFMKCFPPFLQKIHGGQSFTDEQLQQEDYFNYLVARLNPVDRKPELTGKGRRHVLKLMRSVEALYTDIKTNGLRNPLDVWRQDGKLVLHRGGRRLEILHILGVKTVPFRVFRDKKTYNIYKPSKELPVEKDSIHVLGMKQFQKSKERATDKYWVHDYLRLYDRHVGYLRPTAKKILEIGVFRGASLLLWREAFPKAEIFGVDKHTRIWQRFLAGQKRIKVSVGLQEDVEFLKREVIPSGQFDLIVDDGGHLPKPMQASFRALWASVAPGGWYVIEDLFGNYRRDKIKRSTVNMLKDLIDEMNLEGEILSMHFYYNICFIQKRGV
jgi:glycosyltransferase involved in cell wall biosynthesis